jgi:DNA-binding MarR family transcriptional regulator
MERKMPNGMKAKIYKKQFRTWKHNALAQSAYFPVFKELKETHLLRNLSGGALKIYIYLGLHSKQWTGETWVTMEQMAAYFGVSKRTINNWLQELKKKRLIERMQLELNGVSFTFLRPYGNIPVDEPTDNGGIFLLESEE